MIHELKIAPPYFQAVVEGRKNFEIRYNDRGFLVGDTVILKEYDGHYPGGSIQFKIGYITDFEQKHGWVVFSLVKEEGK